MRLVLLFALTTAALYSCLLPLWEGFDEPFHYAYVESLAAGRLPILQHTRIPSELRESLKLTPVGPILHRSLPGSIVYSDWFALPPEERFARRNALESLRSKAAAQPSDLINYEAQQAPLAYALLVPLELLISSMSLPQRILVIRLFAAGMSTLLLFAASRWLAQTLGLEGPLRLLALVCVFESQMLWGSIAHVTNDWLAIPLVVTFAACLASLVRTRSSQKIIALGFLLAAGLLTKAYFLGFVPVFLAVLLYKRVCSTIPFRSRLFAGGIPVLVAGPWYLRNLRLYGNISGIQEITRGVTFLQAFHAFFHINWISGIIDLARWSLWTGNWSFVAFSRNTVNIELLLLAVSFCLLLVRFRQIAISELWIFFTIASFTFALVYYTCVAWVDTGGLAQAAEPWYPQAIMPAIWILACLGLERNGRVGRLVAGVLCVVSAWIAALTYLAKLFPLYGGYQVRATLPEMWKWWTGNPSALLSTTALAPPSVLYALLIGFLALLVALNAAILKKLV
ncbi:MAG: hypothetical protein JOY62_00595 [Acidobacteriaceae bacterium]|nr:hypothetical protein [Acidobacteriaceae bacterium]MBV9778443.1 hypothetical protein [Acidobacteriaceae bacterium]